MNECSLEETPLGTVLYEIEMVRHCAATLDRKKADANISEAHKAEYNLCIEGFLLHFRNLIGFFTNCGRSDELRVDHPEKWAPKPINPKEFARLTQRCKDLDKKYRGNSKSCYQEISRFLMHCTTYRREGAKGWNPREMFAEMEPILNDFEQRFRDTSAETKSNTVALTSVCASTGTVKRFSSF